MRCRRVFVLLFSVGLALGIHATAFAETYHVSLKTPGASDSNDGLSPLYTGGNHGPWKTLVHAGQVAIAGDDVLVYRGDYRRQASGYGVGVVPIENSGQPGAPIRFLGAPGHQPLVNTVRIHDRQWIELRGFRFISPDYHLPSNWEDMPAVVIDDPTVFIDRDEPWETREAKVRQKYATYMAMRDWFLTHYTNGIDVKNSTDLVLSDHDISLYSFGIQVRGHSERLLIENSKFQHCIDGIFTWQPEPSISDSVIRGNTIRQCFNNGMQVREGADGVLIEDNDVMFSGASHISVLSGSSNCTIRHNSGRYGGFYSETMRYPGSTAINVHTSRHGIVVDGNFAAYQIDWTGSDGNGFIADLMLDGAGVLFMNNVAYRNMGSGIRPVESPNCLILANTLVENGYGSREARRGAGINLSSDLDVDNTIVGNILVGNMTAGIKAYYLMDRQTQIDFNLYHGRREVPLIWDGWLYDERFYDTLGKVRQNTSWEGSGRYGRPRFVDRPGEDFRLQPMSPAVDAGSFLIQVPHDFDGVSRPQGSAYDMGAFESH